jgi:translation initiation factor 1A
MDGKIRIGSIAGKMKKRVWLRIGDIIVIVPWAFQDDKQTSYGGTKVRKLNG